MTRRLLAAIALLLLALACAGFVRLNRAPLSVDVYFARIDGHAGEALVLAFVGGWLAGVAGALAWVLRLMRERSAQSRALRLAEGEIRTLRATRPSHAR